MMMILIHSDKNALLYSGAFFSIKKIIELEKLFI
jgi:hypothetical protein